MKHLIALILIIQVLTLASNAYLFHEMSVARQASINYQAETQYLRQEMEYLTHPETVQIRHLEYLMKVGEFK